MDLNYSSFLTSNKLLPGSATAYYVQVRHVQATHVERQSIWPPLRTCAVVDRHRHELYVRHTTIQPGQRYCCTSLATGLLDVMAIPYQPTPIKSSNDETECFSRASKLLLFFTPRIVGAPHWLGPLASIPHTIGNRGLYGRTLEGPTAHSETWD